MVNAAPGVVTSVSPLLIKKCPILPAMSHVWTTATNGDHDATEEHEHEYINTENYNNIEFKKCHSYDTIAMFKTRQVNLPIYQLTFFPPSISMFIFVVAVFPRISLTSMLFLCLLLRLSDVQFVFVKSL